MNNLDPDNTKLRGERAKNFEGFDWLKLRSLWKMSLHHEKKDMGLQNGPVM